MSVGDKVQHLKFGNGQVIGLEGNNDNVKAKIKFEKIGDKSSPFIKQKILRKGNFKNLSSVKSISDFQTKVSVGDKVQHLK